MKKPKCQWEPPVKVERFSKDSDAIISDESGVEVALVRADEGEAICYALNATYPVKRKGKRK